VGRRGLWRESRWWNKLDRAVRDFLQKVMNEVQEKQWALGLELTETASPAMPGRRMAARSAATVEDKPMTITRATDADRATCAMRSPRGTAGLGEALRRALRRDLQPHRRADHGRQIREVTSRVRPDRRGVVLPARGRVSRHGDGLRGGVGFIACAAFITFDVIARRFFGFSSQATTEITGYALAFGIIVGPGARAHHARPYRIDVLINHSPGCASLSMHLLSLAACWCSWAHRQGRLRPGR
jgi:hypothetical protein